MGKLFQHGNKPSGGGGSGGVFGGGAQGGYGAGYGAGYAPQPVYVETPKKSHTGRNALLAGGAGLLGGIAITEAFDDIRDDRREEQAYDQGPFSWDLPGLPLTKPIVIFPRLCRRCRLWRLWRRLRRRLRWLLGSSVLPPNVRPNSSLIFESPLCPRSLLYIFVPMYYEHEPHGLFFSSIYSKLC